MALRAATLPCRRRRGLSPSDLEMFASILNLLFLLQRDEEFLWLQSIRHALIGEAESEEAA